MIEQAIILEALNKLGRDRADVAPGEYSGEALVKIAYDINVGEDYEQAIATKVPWAKIVGVLFSKVNGTTLEAVLEEALEASDELGEDIKERATAAVRELVDQTKTECKGKVTGNAHVLEIVA